MKNKRLIIIGAGPKALAIATKNKVLKDLGFRTPQVVIIEKKEVAAHWTGQGGYTNGNMVLGTGPEKDIGYPYNTTEFSSELNQKINSEMMKFSWMNYLITTDQFSDYVDRGKPFPKHREYAAYLRWVLRQIRDSVTLIYGQVVSLDLVEKKKIFVEYQKDQKKHFVVGDGVMMTGPGPLSTPLMSFSSERVLDVERFWVSYKKLDFQKKLKVAIVGAGENSASIALALGELPHDLAIDIIVPNGFIFTRGESYFENRVYSNPDTGLWKKLSYQDKMNFIQRTDLGVFGQYAQKLLNQRQDIQIVPGLVYKLVDESNQRQVRVFTQYGDEKSETCYDYVVLATGFDQVKTLRDLSSGELVDHIKKSMSIKGLTQSELERRIDRDMSIEGLSPKIHLPMISRIRQGPGFANLSSLGKLSDRVLLDYVETIELKSLCQEVV